MQRCRYEGKALRTERLPGLECLNVATFAFHLRDMMQSHSDTAAKAAADPLLIDLALQGGGAHGAFTWACWIGFSTSPGCESKGFPGPRQAP
jgi:hypothetical protein